MDVKNKVYPKPIKFSELDVGEKFISHNMDGHDLKFGLVQMKVSNTHKPEDIEDIDCYSIYLNGSKKGKLIHVCDKDTLVFPVKIINGEVVRR